MLVANAKGRLATAAAEHISIAAESVATATLVDAVASASCSPRAARSVRRDGQRRVAAVAAPGATRAEAYLAARAAVVEARSTESVLTAAVACAARSLARTAGT